MTGWKLYLRNFLLGTFFCEIITFVYDPQLGDRKFQHKCWGLAWVQSPATLMIPMTVDFAWLIATICIIVLVMVSPGVQKLFMLRPFQFLGKISYTLYLIHYLFVEVMVIWWYDSFRPHMSSVVACWLTFVCVLTCVLIVAWLLQQHVDRAAVRISNTLDKLWFNELPKPEVESDPRNSEILEQVDLVEVARCERYKTRCCNVLKFLKGDSFVQSTFVWMLILGILTPVLHSDRKA